MLGMVDRKLFKRCAERKFISCENTFPVCHLSNIQTFKMVVMKSIIAVFMLIMCIQTSTANFEDAVEVVSFVGCFVVRILDAVDAQPLCGQKERLVQCICQNQEKLGEQISETVKFCTTKNSELRSGIEKFGDSIGGILLSVVCSHIKAEG